MRVFRSGGLTKDAVYLRGLHELVRHLGAGQPLETLWLGKMPLAAVPLVEDLHRRGLLADPLLVPRYLDHPGARRRLARHPRSRLRWPRSSEIRHENRLRHQRHRDARSPSTPRCDSRSRRPREGHETWMMGVDDFSHRADGTVAAHARSRRQQRAQLTRRPRSSRASKTTNTAATTSRVDDLDVLVMRNDPADDMSERPWAVTSGVLFAQLSVAAGTLVVNDPASLANAVNKTYFQHFPEAVRPRTLISRDPGDIGAFVKEMGDGAVLKPLQGSGGTGVFFVSDDESPNLNQMIEARRTRRLHRRSGGACPRPNRATCACSS